MVKKYFFSYLLLICVFKVVFLLILESLYGQNNHKFIKLWFFNKRTTKNLAVEDCKAFIEFLHRQNRLKKSSFYYTQFSEYIFSKKNWKNLSMHTISICFIDGFVHPCPLSFLFWQRKLVIDFKPKSLFLNFLFFVKK